EYEMDETSLAMRFGANLGKRLRALKTKDQEDASALEFEAPSAPRAPAPAMPSPRAVAEDPSLSVESLAAVPGRLRPDDLFTKELEELVRQAILSWLGPFCIVETLGTEVQWVLRQGARKTTLSRLNDQGRLQSLLEQELPPTDSFGERLRELLRN